MTITEIRYIKYHWHYCIFFMFSSGSFLLQELSSSAVKRFRSTEEEKLSNIIQLGISSSGVSNKEDEYLCTAKALSSHINAQYISHFEYNFDKSRVHHFLLYGCKITSDYFLTTGKRSCYTKGKGPICIGRKQIPLGLSDPVVESNITSFPINVGYGIGQKFDINFLLLEMHFIKANNSNNDSLNYGIKIHTNTKTPNFLSGMLVMVGVGFRIPPGREKFSIDINCQPRISSEIHPYAYWVHTHRLGKVISGYKVDKKTGTVTELARWSHHWHQPVVLDSLSNETLNSSSKFTIRPKDFVTAKCTYNSSQEIAYVNWGGRRDLDEMCNLFLFYYSSSSDPRDLSLSCVNELSRDITSLLPSFANSLPDSVDMNKTTRSNSNNQTSNRNEIFKSKYSSICDLYYKIGIKYCPFQKN